MRLQRAMVGVVVAVITVLTAYIVIGRQFAVGPILVSVSNSHGLHLTDLPVLGLWAIGMGVCAVLWVRPPAR